MDEPTDPDHPERTPSVTREVEVEASPDELWRAITDDDERAAWWGGDTALDLRPGGAGHATDPDGTVRHIRVEEVEPGRRLSYHWWTDDTDDGSSVELVVVPRPGGSRLTVIETRPTCSVGRRGASAGALAGRLLDLELLLLSRTRV